MTNRAWGSHYPNGSLVLAAVEGNLELMVVTRHGGDYFHHFTIVTVEPNLSHEELDHLVGHPELIQYSGYWAGPIVGHLDDAQMMSLGGGIDVPKLELKTRLTSLLYIISEERLSPLASLATR